MNTDVFSQKIMYGIASEHNRNYLRVEKKTNLGNKQICRKRHKMFISLMYLTRESKP
jgi:hypothetical protein